MEKRTLQFTSLTDLALFSRIVSVGFLINTNNLTLTGKFPEIDVYIAISQYKADIIETTEKVFSY